MTPYGYVIVNSCIISFNCNCIMQLKQFYNIATKVTSRKKVLLLSVIYLTVYTAQLNLISSPPTYRTNTPHHTPIILLHLLFVTTQCIGMCFSCWTHNAIHSIYSLAQTAFRWNYFYCSNGNSPSQFPSRKIQYGTFGCCEIQLFSGHHTEWRPIFRCNHEYSA